MLYLILLFSFIIPSFGDISQCIDRIKNSTYTSILQNSASRPFELGLYDTCLNDENSHYLILYTAVPLLQLATGICVSNDCTLEDINGYIIPQVLFPIVPSFFNPNVTFALDPKQAEKSFDGGGIAILTIIGLFFALSLVAPIYKIMSGMSLKKQTQDSQKGLLQEDDMENNKEKVPSTSLPLQVFNAFSLEINFKKMFTLREGKLDFFNCLRALSLFYVIFGHEFMLRLNQISNSGIVTDLLKKPLFLLASGGFYAVDVFYYLSGFFMAFVLIEGDLK